MEALPAHVSSTEFPSTGTEEAPQKIDPASPETLLERARILSLNSEFTSLLDQAGEKEMAESTPAIVRTLKAPQPFRMVNVGRASSPPPMPTLTVTHGELSSSHADDSRSNVGLARPLPVPESSSRTSTPLPSESSHSSRSGSLKSTAKRLPGPDPLHLTRASSRSHLAPDYLSIPLPPSPAMSHFTMEEEEEEEVYSNDSLSNVLSETKCLAGIIACAEWPGFLALTQTCRGARRAVLEGRDNEKLVVLRYTPSHPSLSSVGRVRMTAPVREEILIGYVEGYSYLANKIERVVARRNTPDTLTSRTRPTKTVVTRGNQKQSDVKNFGNRNVVTKTQAQVDIKKMKASLEEVQLLYISSLTPLHVYPTNALTSLSRPSMSRPPSNSSDTSSTRPIEVTQRLQALTLAHSKFVLLLRNMADQLQELRKSDTKLTSSIPNANESGGRSRHNQPESDSEQEHEEDLFDAHTYIGGGASDGSMLPRGSRHNVVRELVFPAPLAGSASSSRTTQGSEPGNGPEDASVHPAHSRFASDSAVTSSTTARTPNSKASNAPSSFRGSSMSSPKASSLATPRSSSESVASLPSKRLSLLKPKGPFFPPPLPSEPQTLKAYSSGWRKSLFVASENHRHRINRRSTLDYNSGPDEFGVEDSSRLRPHRRFTTSPSKRFAPLPVSSSGSESSNASSANSSRRNSGNYSSGNSSPSPERRDSDRGAKGKEVEPTKRNTVVQFDERAARRISAYDKLSGDNNALSRRGAPAIGSRQNSLTPRAASRSTSLIHPSHLATSPHDLVLATSRLRAPVLRVYVPCSELSDSSSELASSSSSRRAGINVNGQGRATSAPVSSIQQVEAELIRAGVWEWMQGGEVVVNFGYMPGASISTGRPKLPSRPSSRQQNHPARESQIFSNFSPPPPGANFPTPFKAVSVLGINGRSVPRASGRFFDSNGPETSSPPTSFRSPAGTPNATPGPSRVSSSSNIANGIPQSRQNAMPRPSRQSTYDSLPYAPTGPSRQSTYLGEPTPQALEATWLIYNGNYLVPYCPSAAEVEALLQEDASKRPAKKDQSFLPIDDPLSLPSPFYYDHILGAEGRLKVRIDCSKFPKSSKAEDVTKSHIRSKSDPSARDTLIGEVGSYFREDFSSHSHSIDDSLDGLLSGDAGISMSLQTIPTLLHSPGAGSGGWVRVRKWKWVARTLVSSSSTEPEKPANTQPLSTSFRSSTYGNGSSWLTAGNSTQKFKKGLGRGWLEKTWVLEGEGTKEGRDFLLSCLKTSSYTGNSAKMEWEIVRDKTTKATGGKGMLWFRLLPASAPSGSLDGDESTVGY
ncbi:hypothetical protein V5O48_002951 [Marasmius crinis-equi]|uniref:Uncharacterized protein n=1 Tax=Marasmius crinis-equi TaxID=585013 RepID=A0ABR3FU99_9AGAR